MAKIIKVGSQNPTFTSKAPNLAKTSRAGNITNPFKFTNFEGNTLQFADVFEGFEPKQTNKLKMIASSVAGSMNKIKNGIPESIVNFVNRVRTGISNAWGYMNTPIEIPGMKNFTESMSSTLIGKGITKASSIISNGISTGIDYLNKDAVEVGRDINALLYKDVTPKFARDLAEKWSGIVSRIHQNDLSNMSVAEIEQRWIDLKAAGEAA